MDWAFTKIADTDFATEVSDQTANKIRSDIAQTSISQAKNISFTTIQNLLN